MTEDQLELFYSLARGELDCSLLYRVSGGYVVAGGRYEHLQHNLQNNGWNYDIRKDCWIKQR